MIDINFQTTSVNAKHHERIRAAREAVSSATGMLILTLLKAYPVGAHVRLLVGPRKFAPYIVHEHTAVPSRWVTLRHAKTGSKRAIDIVTSSIELATYSYEVTHLATSYPEGHQQALTDANAERVDPENVLAGDFVSGDADADPLKRVPSDRRYSVVPE